MKTTTTSLVKTVRRSSAVPRKRSQTIALNVKEQPRSKDKGSKETQRALAPVQAAIYMVKGDKRMNPAKICPLPEKKHYVLNGKECWHRVQIIDLGEIK